MIRPGLSLYGISPNPALIEADLRPIMSLKTRVVQLRPFADGESVSYGRTYVTKGAETIAVVPIGYADGLHRALSGKMEMFVHGQRVPQVGRICMDMCMLNVTDIEKTSVGDEVTVFGGDEDESPSVYEQARLAGTIPYEMLTSVSSRVPRRYSHGVDASHILT
jgi:alanine racemase